MNNEEKIKIIGECLKAIAYGPFIIDGGSDDPYWEISALMGVSIEKLREIENKWPDVELNEETKIIINNSINNLLGYPHNVNNEIWSQYISISKQNLKEIRNELISFKMSL